MSFLDTTLTGGHVFEHGGHVRRIDVVVSETAPLESVNLGPTAVVGVTNEEVAASRAELVGTSAKVCVTRDLLWRAISPQEATAIQLHRCRRCRDGDFAAELVLDEIVRLFDDGVERSTVLLVVGFPPWILLGCLQGQVFFAWELERLGGLLQGHRQELDGIEEGPRERLVVGIFWD